MTQVISVHSFRGGTGKSNTTANIATLMAAMSAAADDGFWRRVRRNLCDRDPRVWIHFVGW